MNLFEDLYDFEPRQEELGPGAMLLRRFVAAEDRALLSAIEDVSAQAPFRHMITPGGFRMSVAMTNCGALGWVSDNAGYRYDAADPVSGLAWPAMPEIFLTVARDAAAQAGFGEYVPDACLINRYEPGARITLHQDRNERDFEQPIASVSLGLPAVFLFGGLRRADKVSRVPVTHGDVVVWGGPSRLRYHGVMPLKAGRHELVGEWRMNLTFRVAG
jgi:alkylated DNA repair protein (DNA oxidative demethylase)